jgi:DNA modification methylase
MCGDSTKIEDVEKLMDGQTSMLLHADPPYGMGKEKDGVLNDNLYKEKLDKFQIGWWQAFRPCLKENASVYIWGNAEDLWRLWYNGLKESERLTFRNEIVWNKKHGQGIGSEKHRMYPTATERILFFMLGEQGFKNNADNYFEGWEPIRDYLLKSRKELGWDVPTMKKIVGHSDLSRDHWTSKSQFNFPTEKVYKAMQKGAREQEERESKKYSAFKKKYSAFKKEYSELKKEFYKTRAFFDNTHDNMTDVWEHERVTGKERNEHATPKPVELMTRIIKSSSIKNEIVIEPFLGSGSTLIACEKTNRICYGMELEPKYIDTIIKRYEDYTGNKAKLIQ